jgi:hypothetical protein
MTCPTGWIKRKNTSLGLGYLAPRLVFLYS